MANGGKPAAARAIVDVDLTELPELPVSNKDYSRTGLETRIKIKAANAANAQKRLQITLEAWTEIYTLLKTSTEITAPMLSRDLKLNCDLSLVSEHDGSFDGPRAWRLTLNYLEQGQKNEGEKDFYRTAERIQRASHLPDGCQATEYSKKALAFLVHIKPNLSQSYSASDTVTKFSGLTGAVDPLLLGPDGIEVEAGDEVRFVSDGTNHDRGYTVCGTASPSPPPAVTSASTYSCLLSTAPSRYVCAASDGSGGHGFVGNGRTELSASTVQQCADTCAVKAAQVGGGCCEARYDSDSSACLFREPDLLATVKYSSAHADSRAVLCLAGAEDTAEEGSYQTGSVCSKAVGATCTALPGEDPLILPCSVYPSSSIPPPHTPLPLLLTPPPPLLNLVFR